MNKPIIFMAMFFFTLQFAQSQSPEGLFSCETIQPATPASYSPEQLNQCFTVSEVQSNCAKVWIRINFHFFVDDNCEGSIDPICGESDIINCFYIKKGDVLT